MSGKTGGWLCLIIHCTYCSTSLGGICANFLCKTTIYGYVKQKLLFSPAECPLAYPRHDDPTSRILVLALTVAHDPLCKLLSDALTLQIPPTSSRRIPLPAFLGFRQFSMAASAPPCFRTAYQCLESGAFPPLHCFRRSVSLSVHRCMPVLSVDNL